MSKARSLYSEGLRESLQTAFAMHASCYKISSQRMGLGSPKVYLKIQFQEDQVSQTGPAVPIATATNQGVGFSSANLPLFLQS
jgi:hypothetical protein